MVSGTRLGPYQIVAPLGVGGMGEVYLAEDIRLRRKLALKLLPDRFTQDAERVHRFEREARAASTLNHPNILTIYETGETGGIHYISTEFVDGQTLRQRLAEGPVPLEAALDVAMQVAAALTAAHAAGIVHRDIKPENIMRRPDGLVKVLDFGLAKLTEHAPFHRGPDAPTVYQPDTEPGAVMGTVAYMSPDQVRGQPVDARTDVWSLGVVLYEMVTGRAPFAGKTPSDSIAAILQCEPTPLGQAAGPVPAELERIVSKALTKNLAERYQAIKDLHIDLGRLKHELDLKAEQASAGPTETPGPTAEPKPAESAKPKKLARARAFLIVMALLVVMTIGAAVWLATHSKPLTVSQPVVPERELHYWLTVQRMRDGAPYQSPFESSGQEIFENGWKFRLNFSSPQVGHLYLLNEGPAEGGLITFNLLFPTPGNNAGEARLTAQQSLQTRWNFFDEHPGTEQFWLVWAAAPVPELEALKALTNPTDRGEVRDPAQIRAVRALLTRHAAQSKPEVEKDRVKNQTVVRGRGEVLVSLLELAHR